MYQYKNKTYKHSWTLIVHHVARK